MADSSCSGGGAACWLADQASILTNIANSLVPVENLVTGSAYLIGLMFVLKALMGFRHVGESKMASGGGGHTMKEPLTYLVVGALLLYFPTTLQVLMQTTFGYQNILQYAPTNSSNNAIDTLFGSGSTVGQPIAIIIQVIGLVAFVRGWVLIARSASQGQQPGGTGKGLVHVFGGILAMNIVGTLQVINNTLFGT
jgi:intracellular multiplication protein IcmC